MSLLHRINSLARYAIGGKTRYYLHSPFVYDFAEKILNDKRNFYAFQDIETLKATLVRSDTLIQTTDCGAGNSRVRRLADMLKTMSIPAHYGKLLFRMVNYYQPQHLLEFGTALGISTLYQALPKREAHFVSMEGCPNTAAAARQHLQQSGCGRVEVQVGNFDDILPNVLQTFTQLDWVFFDGNHRLAPTLRYFETCLAKAHENSIFVFDDVHWSPEMSEAWQYIKAHPRTRVTIDLWRLGIVFFRSTQAKEHFVLYY